LTRAHALALAGLLAAYCGLAVVVPHMDDELYYWCWAERLQPSYYDHPPMTALFIRASTAVFGDTLFGIRFPACVSTVFLLGVILHLTRPAGLAWWLVVTPLFTLGAVLITPDTPLLVFWSAYLLWLVAVHRRLTPVTGEPVRAVPGLFWLVGGVLVGCGVLGKYTAGLAGIAGFLSFLLAGSWRRWLPGFALHGLVAFVVASPILVYNVGHDFEPLKYQWGHAMGQTEPDAGRFAEFVGIQVALFGTLPLVLFPWVVANLRRLTADPRLRVCACLYGFPFAFFLFKAARGPLEGNWALASYVAFWPLAAAWYESVRGRGWEWAVPAAFAIPAGVAAATAVHLIHPLPLLTPANDRITRQSVKFAVAQQLRDTIAARGEQLPVYVETYQMAALLRFQGIDARQIDGASRPSHFTQTPHRMADAARSYVVWDGRPRPELTDGCELVEVVAAYPILVRGCLKTHYVLLLYRNPARSYQTPTAGK
jgi:4-amino-4-deoxy-L-arabinose transferase-like glycosyltransferase